MHFPQPRWEKSLTRMGGRTEVAKWLSQWAEAPEC